MKRKYMIIVLMAGALELTGCSQGTSNSAKNGTTGSENTIISESDIAILDTEDMFTERDRDTEYDESECTAISLSDEETKLLTDKESPEEAAEIRGCFYHQKISFFHSPHGKERSAMTSQIHPLKPCPHTFHGHSLPLR